MARKEIDSFILKFKNLLLSGRNATLVLKSNAGKAEVNLSVELGDVLSQPHSQHRQRHGPRNGPSRERRRIRRAEARKAAEVAEHVEEMNVDSTKVEKAAEEATNHENDSKDETASNEHPTLRDEFCSNKSFESESDCEIVEKLLITADCQADWSNRVVTKLVAEKLQSIGIEMTSIEVNRNIRKCFDFCVATIKPMKRQLMDRKTFPINRWTMKYIS